jgi:hypothetical protein
MSAYYVPGNEAVAAGVLVRRTRPVNTDSSGQAVTQL